MDSFTSALARLDPASRALLDLSLRRGMRPEEIGDLLGTDPESVVVAREGALEQLATELEMGDVSELDNVRTRLAELPAEAWTGAAPTGNGAPPAAERPKLAVLAEEEKRESPKPEPAKRKPEPERKSRTPLLLGLLAVAAVVLVVVLASSGGDKSNTAATSSPAPQQKPTPAKPTGTKPAPAKPAARTVSLASVGGAGGVTGTAALTQGGKRLRVDVSGLPDPHGGAYQVWLYDSVIDAVSLVKVGGTKLALDLKLPQNASHYRYLDISLEPADGNPNHSGQSVLRVPLSKLSG
jgi:hypothetical protein